MLSVGDRAPEFEAEQIGGGTFRLSEALAKAEVLLYFFPKTFTSVCTKQSQAMRDRAAGLAEAGVQVVAVSPDDEDVTQKFCETYGLVQTTLLDPDRAIAAQYQVTRVGGWLPNRRITYRIAKDGTVPRPTTASSGSKAT